MDTTYHFWVGDTLWEVRYYPTIRGWQKVYASERKCECYEGEQLKKRRELALAKGTVSRSASATVAD